MSNVDHPAHYGGADNPYEAIKVMEAWLTPEEFVGGLKFSFFTYQARARQKNGLEDHEKAAWYQARLIEFIKRTGYHEGQVSAPPPVFWTEEGADPTQDPYDCLVSAPQWEPVAVHCSVAPHVRWMVRIPLHDAAGEPDGDEIETYPSFEAARAICDSAKHEQEEAIDRATGRLDVEPVELPPLPRGHSALHAAADLVVEDGVITKWKDAHEAQLGQKATRATLDRADLVIENGRAVYVRPGLVPDEPPMVPRVALGSGAGA